MQSIFESILIWIKENIDKILFFFISAIIILIIYFILKKYIIRLKKKEQIDEVNAKNLIRLFKIVGYTFGTIFLAIAFAQELSYFAGIITVAGGTVIGFAAMSTLGNLIAGVLIIIRKPFKVGDRIFFKKRIADVIDIKLIYTVLKDLNNVKIFVPNQKLLKEEIENYGEENILRREIKVSIDYNEDPRKVEKAFFEVVGKFTNILKSPEPRVDIYEFLDYAIQYRLLVYINTSKIIPKIDFDLRRAIYYTFKDYQIGLVTPSIYKKVSSRISEDTIIPES